MALTVTSNLSPQIQAYYDKRFLLRAKHDLIAYQLAQKRKLPGGVGKTVYFSRYIPLQKQTEPLTETLDGGLNPATRQQIKTEEIAATVALWGDYVQISKLASITSIDQEVSEKVDLLGQQAGETIDYYLLKKLSTNVLRRRPVTAAAGYQVEGTATSGTTTSIVSPVLDQEDGYWTEANGNGSYVTVIAGTNYGLTRKITASGSSSISWVEPMPKPCDSTTVFRVVGMKEIAASNVLDTATMRLVNRDLKRARSMKFERGYNVVLVDPDVEYDFMGDNLWVDAAKYKDNVDALYTGEIGRWFGNRFVATTQLFRQTLAGVESETGAAHIVVALAKECFGAVELEGQQKKIYVMTPEQLGQPIPMFSTCGWQVGFEAVVLNGVFGVAIPCGATA